MMDRAISGYLLISIVFLVIATLIGRGIYFADWRKDRRQRNREIDRYDALMKARSEEAER
jgi:preprotein translocase subunit YajC